MDGPEAALGSPIFDVPELPALRRVKPLPKRRRTSAPDDATTTTTLSTTAPNPLLAPLLPPTPGPDAPAEELTAHAEALTAQMALQSYYMPILNGVHDLMGGAVPDEDGDGDDGDYFDHQLGNTKKRKVPANPQLGDGSGETHEGGEDDDGGGSADRAIPVGGGRNNDDYDGGTTGERPSSPAGWTPQRCGRMLPATIVGLQRKEMLKYRKRQLAAVLGALSHGDTLALDQALSAHYPLLARRVAADLRLRKRRRVRPSRARTSTIPVERRVALPEGEFTFVCHSATSDRLVATREEVAVLHQRIEAELTRQAAKAEEVQKQAEAALALASTKRTDRMPRKARTGTTGTGTTNNTPLTIAPPPPAAKRGKKKKRSALANASNPHHLRNYVPSRLPNQGPTNTTQSGAGAQNLLNPLPLRFLSAQVPSRTSSLPASGQQLVNPADEWICPTCEYRLFYGDDAAYRLAVRNRKKILKRRQRARERAAAAASGKKGVAAREGDGEEEDDDTDLAFEGAEGEGGISAMGRQQTGRVEKDRDRGQGHGHGG